MEDTVINVLKKASDCYYNSENYYEATEDEVNDIINDLHIQCQSLMTDSMFDEIYSRAKEKYPENPYFLSVGSEVRGGKVKLPIPLGSMTEAKEGDMAKWMVGGHYCISAKLDGISCLLVYENGLLKIAYSRGDGINGQDITRTVKHLLSVPDRIPDTDGDECGFTGYIRGEVIIPRENIQKCIDELKEETGKEYKNGRNLTAGQLNAETANKAFLKYANFVAYNIYNWRAQTHQMFDTLKSMGFLTPFYMVSNNIAMTDEYLENLIEKLKFAYCYEVDGVICTMETPDDDHQGFETGTLNPKSSRKVKIGLKKFGTKECEVIGISWQISKNYKLKPVINIRPVELNGSTISNITGNNFKFLIDNNIFIGVKGLFAKNGDVIPGWIKTIDSKGMDMSGILMKDSLHVFDYEGLKAYWNIPLNPRELAIDGVDLVLGEEVDDKDNGYPSADYFEYSLEACLQQTLYFCTKLGVDFAGYGNIKALAEATCNPSFNYRNLCTLPLREFEDTIGVNGIKLYNSLHQKITNATPTQLADATGCFGDGIGELKLNKIVDKYGDLPYDRQKVLDTDGWADISADQYMYHYASYISMVEFFQENDMWKGFTIIEATGDKCKDIRVVFTGIRSAEMEDVIRKNGGRVLSSFTKECNLVIAKDPMGNSGKLAKAREKGVEIISLDEAFQRYGHKNENVPMQKLDISLVNKLLGK